MEPSLLIYPVIENVSCVNEPYSTSKILELYSLPAFFLFICLKTFSKAFVLEKLGVWIKDSKIKECSLPPTLKSPGACIRPGFA